MSGWKHCQTSQESSHWIKLVQSKFYEPCNLEYWQVFLLLCFHMSLKGKILIFFLKFDWRLFFKIQDGRYHHFGKTKLYIYIWVFLLPLVFKSSEHDVQRCPWTSYEAKTTKKVILKIWTPSTCGLKFRNFDILSPIYMKFSK